MPGRSQRKIGSRLHRAKPGDILDAMAEYCTRCSTEKDIARSYAYGFILHYALDRQCHPFVYAKQQELADSGSPLHKSALHNIVEMSMDAVLLHSCTLTTLGALTPPLPCRMIRRCWTRWPDC